LPRSFRAIELEHWTLKENKTELPPSKNKISTVLNSIKQSFNNFQVTLIVRLRKLYTNSKYWNEYSSKTNKGFQVRGVNFKKLRLAEGGANIFGVFFPILRGAPPPTHTHTLDSPLFMNYLFNLFSFEFYISQTNIYIYIHI
jgi:hypothetical protein